MADEEDKKEGAEGEEAPKKKKSDSNLVGLLVTVIVVLLIQAGIAFFVVKISVPKEEEPVEEVVTDTTAGGDISNAAIGKEAIIPAEFEQVVNIAGTDGMRFLKVGISIAYDSENDANANLLMILAENEVRIRSHVVQYLSSLNLEQVHDRNAQQNIRRDLLRELNKQLPPNSGELSNVYITEYIVQ